MNESEIPIVSNQAASAASGSRGRRRVTARRKTAAPSAKAARRAPAASKRKSAPRPRPAAARGGDLQWLLQTLASRAAGARGRLVAASGHGAQATRRAWHKVSDASRRTIDRMTREWKQMDTAKKAQFIAALLTALAAASAPIVRRGLKKR